MALVKTKFLENKESDLPDGSSDYFTADKIICKNPQKLVDLVFSMEEKKSVHFVSNGDWSTNDLVMLLLQKYRPAELYFTTYAIREMPIRQLILARDRNELSAINMLVDYRAKVRTPEVYQLAKMNASQIFLTAIHAKVCVLKTATEYVTINGSANWTSNPRIESGVLTLNKEVGEFHIDWIQKVMNNAEIFT